MQGCKSETNDRLLGVAVHSHDHENLTNIRDVSETLKKQVEAFFVSYNKQRGKKFRIIGTGGPRKAIPCLECGIRAYRRSHRKRAA